MARATREWKPKDQYYRDKIDYCERKLLWLYEQMAKYDPNFRPNLVLNEPIVATVVSSRSSPSDDANALVVQCKSLTAKKSVVGTRRR